MKLQTYKIKSNDNEDLALVHGLGPQTSSQNSDQGSFVLHVVEMQSLSTNCINLLIQFYCTKLFAEAKAAIVSYRNNFQPATSLPESDST